MKGAIFYLLVFIFSVFTSYSLMAQDDLIIKRKPHAIGLTANSFSGLGISYNYFPDKFGVQINTFGMKQDKDWVAAIGGSLYYSFSRSERFNLIGHISNLYIYESYYYTLYPGNSGYDINRIYNIGIGPGLEIMSEHFSCILTYGIGFYDNFNIFMTLGGGITFLVHL